MPFFHWPVSTGDSLFLEAGHISARLWGFAVESFVIPQTRFIPGVPLGHNRQPDLAASFFVRVMGLVGKLRILTSTDSGPAPFPVSLSLQLPHHVDKDGLSYLWTLDGEYLAESAEVYTSIANPGPHDIRVVIIEANGSTLRASRQITVSPPGS